jgi:hypothetical protein
MNYMLKKCGRQDLTVFHLMAIEKSKILGAVFELPAKQQCQSSPFTSKRAKWAELAVLFS